VGLIIDKFEEPLKIRVYFANRFGEVLGDFSIGGVACG
jgi:hypothetical protein